MDIIAKYITERAESENKDVGELLLELVKPSLVATADFQSWAKAQKTELINSKTDQTQAVKNQIEGQIADLEEVIN